MGRERWLTSRITYVETTRAVELRSRPEDAVAAAFANDWQSFEVVELTAPVAELAASLAVATRLRSLDAIHLASAMVAAAGDPVFATWDARLHVAAGERGYALLPERL
jgi:predicted nucleic acid-binding protein